MNGNPFYGLRSIQVFGEEFIATCRLGRSQDQAIPKGNLMENAAIDSLFNHIGTDGNRVKNAKILEVLFG